MKVGNCWKLKTWVGGWILEVECWKLEARLGCLRIDEILDMRYWRKEPGDCRCRLDTMENGKLRLKVGGWKLETVGWDSVGWRLEIGEHGVAYR